MKPLKILAKYKVYFGGASLYLSVINFLLAISTVTRLYNINISIWLMIPLGFCGTIFIGWLDYKLIRRYENEHSNRVNDIREYIEKIDIKMDKFMQKVKEIQDTTKDLNR